jgi:D-alanyl-D-alanine carboxypeptidase
MFMASNGQRRHWKRSKKFIVGLLIILMVGVVVNYFRPIPPITAVKTLKTEASTITPLQWPDIGSAQAAIGADGYGLLATDGPQIEQPTASTAKLVTALMVLKKYPLQIGQTTTPIITLGPNDVAIYKAYLAEDGSVAAVTAGEQISEYQALQAMLLPSANNIADSLAIWAYGSLINYSVAANSYLANVGLKNTIIGTDASGFLPSTTSTASNLTLLGLDALQNPVIAQIVAEKQTIIPVAGVIYNVNQLLGQNGVVGIKTGNSDQAGGVYVFAANDEVDKVSPRHDVLIVGTIQGVPTLANSFTLGEQLINFAENTFNQSIVATVNEQVGYYRVPWDKNNVYALSQSQLTSINWSTNYPKPALTLNALKGSKLAGSSIVGKISEWRSTTNYDISNVVLSQNISSAPWWWRILRFNP